MKHIISLGAGVQSSTMALMAARGEITPMPEAAIFADTQWEPAEVTRHLDWLETQLPFPVYRVTRGNLREKILTGEYSDVPFFTDNGLGRRQCTYQFKLRPLRKEVRSRYKSTYKNPLTMWIGISRDEVFRRKESNVKYIQNRWPLLDMGMRRHDCIDWFADRYPGRALPRSACLGCPFHTDAEWRHLRDGDQTEWLQTLSDDDAIRSTRPTNQFMHSSLKPLREADIDSLEDKGQGNLFDNECEGMCGV